MTALELTKWEIKNNVSLNALKRKIRKDSIKKTLNQMDWDSIEIQVADEILRSAKDEAEKIKTFSNKF